MSPDPRGGCAQGWLLGTYQDHVLGTRDPSHICVLGTQSPDRPNGPTDSAPQGRWRDLQLGGGGREGSNSKYIFCKK